MKPFLFVCLLAAAAFSASAADLLVPRIASDWTTIAKIPGLGELSADAQSPVDLAISQGADGTWQLLSCIRGAKERGKTQQFSGWQSLTLEAADWQPKDIAVQADHSFSAESRHVVEPRPGQFYLFRTQTYGAKAQTTVYHSTDPLDFGQPDKNGDAMHLMITLPVAAPEVFQHNGQWFIAALRPDLKGIQLARLAWDELAPIALKPRSQGSGQPIRVALFDDYGSFGKGVPRCTELLQTAENIAVTKVKPALIRSGGLKDFDVVIFTGGSASKQAATLGLLGREQVRRFIHAGGGYIGICAGNYLACEGFSWGVHILDAKTKSSKWARGVGDVKIEFTEQGQNILGMPAGITDIRYANGPIFNPAGNDGIGDFQTLAVFRTELAKNGAPVGAMVNSPAMVAGDYGRGRVLCSSPHPEQQAGMEHFVAKAVEWVAGEPQGAN